jgi:hypothetical protein
MCFQLAFAHSMLYNMLPTCEYANLLTFQFISLYNKHIIMYNYGPLGIYFTMSDNLCTCIYVLYSAGCYYENTFGEIKYTCIESL